MKLFTPFLSVLLLICGFSLASCDGWRTDYGEVVAQFDEADLATKASAYDDEKISVRGKVKSVDTSDPQSLLVSLELGTSADFGDLAAMVAAMKPGETVTIDGILRIDGDEFLLDPAIQRSHDAPFDPAKR